MKEIRWTPQAADDLEALHKYIARDSERYASAVVAMLVSGLDRLELRCRTFESRQDGALGIPTPNACVNVLGDQMHLVELAWVVGAVEFEKVDMASQVDSRVRDLVVADRISCGGII